jgi:hypothetical protein
MDCCQARMHGTTVAVGHRRAGVNGLLGGYGRIAALGLALGSALVLRRAITDHDRRRLPHRTARCPPITGPRLPGDLTILQLLPRNAPSGSSWITVPVPEASYRRRRPPSNGTLEGPGPTRSPMASRWAEVVLASLRGVERELESTEPGSPEARVPAALSRSPPQRIPAVGGGRARARRAGAGPRPDGREIRDGEPLARLEG